MLSAFLYPVAHLLLRPNTHHRLKIFTVFMMLHRFNFLGFLACMLSFSSFADDTAKLLFERNAPMVLQIQVIDAASGNKSTIGSGFQISPAGVITTNYHVVSDYILEREKYTIQVLDHDNRPFDATLINFDIVHDLALLQVVGLDKKALTLSRNQLSQGDRIFAMGNPNDLGMTIIDGIYNGLVEASRYQKYLFSGSLNSGMSGGPAFNSRGEVIGVNVAKGGEQISFLIPVAHLRELAEKGSRLLNVEDYNARARDDLMADQDHYYSTLIASDWLTNDFQQFDLPDRIHDSMKCWGHTLENEDGRFEETHRHCTTEDKIYIGSDFYTGSFSFNYVSVTSDELNTQQFYTLLEQSYAMAKFSNSNDKEDTTNLRCATEFLVLGDERENNGRPWKVTTCIREYVAYKGLYDAGLIAIRAGSSEDGRKALMISLYTTGIDNQNITGLHSKFLRSVK